MSRSRARNKAPEPIAFKPLAEGEPLETTREFEELSEAVKGQVEKLVEANTKAYLEAIRDLKLTKEAETAGQWPREEDHV